MIKPEDVPDEAVEALEAILETNASYSWIKKSIAAALTAWPGASEENRQLQSWNAQGGIDTKWRKHIILRLGDSK